MDTLKLFLSKSLSDILLWLKVQLNFSMNGSVQAKVSGWNMEFAGPRTEVLLA